jgi:flagellar motor switch protein FliN/FliY
MADDTMNDENNGTDDLNTGDDWAQALSETGEAAGDSTNARFDDLGDGIAGGDTNNLDFLLDIPLEVTVELGRTSMIINNLLQLSQGSVVELNKAAADPVEIYVNHKLLGKGEVIIVNERFGVRITEIISQAERIKNMG